MTVAAHARPAAGLPGHHPDGVLLLDYATGAAPEGASLLVASHLTFCPACRAAVARLEDLGGAMIADLPPTSLAPGSLEAMLDRLDADVPMAPARPMPVAAPPLDGELQPPGLLRDYIAARVAPNTAGALPWRKRGGPVAEITLSRPGARETIRLLRIRAGAAVPRHTHRGSEMVLVLAGGYSDPRGRYRRGDVTVSDETIDHRPVADADGDCICLWVTDAPLHFTGVLGRILNLFVRF